MFMWQKLQQERNERLKRAQQAASQGNAEGLYDMGLRYRYGWGVESDIKAGLELLAKAAKKQHAGACYELARLYLHGNLMEGVSQDLNKALDYAMLGASADINLFKAIENYNQEKMVNQNKDLLNALQNHPLRVNDL